jgi:hypothetical protein
MSRARGVDFLQLVCVACTHACILRNFCDLVSQLNLDFAYVEVVRTILTVLRTDNLIGRVCLLFDLLSLLSIYGVTAVSAVFRLAVSLPGLWYLMSALQSISPDAFRLRRAEKLEAAANIIIMIG